MRAVKFLLALMLMLAVTLPASAAPEDEDDIIHFEEVTPIRVERNGIELLRNDKLHFEEVTPIRVERDGTELLRTYLESPSKEENVSCRVQMIIHNPYLHGSINYRDVTLKDKSYSKGFVDLLCFLTPTKERSMGIPFYVVEENGKSTVYIKLDDQWKKESNPLDDDTTPDVGDADAVLEFVKGATLIEERGFLSVLRVTLDNVKAVDELEASLTAKKGELDVNYKNFLDAMRTVDGIDFYLTINTVTNQAQMIEADFSGLVQGFSGKMLDAYSTIIAFEPTLNETLSSLTSGTEVKLYISFDDDTEINVKDFALPREAKKAKKAA